MCGKVRFPARRPWEVTEWSWKVNPTLQQNCQDAGDAKTMGRPPEKAVCIEWSWPKSSVLFTIGSRGEAGLPKAARAQGIPSSVLDARHGTLGFGVYLETTGFQSCFGPIFPVILLFLIFRLDIFIPPYIWSHLTCFIIFTRLHS